MVDKTTVGKTVVSDEPSVGEDGSMVGNKGMDLNLVWSTQVSEKT